MFFGGKSSIITTFAGAEKQDAGEQLNKPISRIRAYLCDREYHRWTKWRVRGKIGYYVQVDLQQRHCVDCGIVQQLLRRFEV